MWALFIGIPLFFLRLNWDYNTWLDKRPIKHGRRHAIIAVPAMFVIYCFALYLGIHLFWSILASAGMYCFTWWYWYNRLFNTWRGLPKWFLGSETGKDAALTDRFLRRLTLKAHKILLIGGMTFFILLYITIKIFL